MLSRNKLPAAPTSTSHSLSLAGQLLHYRRIEGGAGIPLVLLHGYGNSGHIWHYTLSYLAQQHPLYIVDLPGFGQSSQLGPWRLQAIAPLLAEWLSRLQLPKIALVGHSMGGAIAIHLAAYAPEQVGQLILINAVGLPLQASLPSLALRSARSFLQRGNGSYPPALLRDILQPHVRLLWQSARELTRSDLRAELASITQPTLIIWGERDVMIPLSFGQALSTALPHAQFVVLPGCGHRPMLAQPQALSNTVLSFLEITTTPPT